MRGEAYANMATGQMAALDLGCVKPPLRPLKAPDPTPSATGTHRIAMRSPCGSVRTIFDNVNTGRIESE